MKSALTPKQEKILDFIENYVEKQNRFPTTPIITKAFKMHRQATHRFLRELCRRGFLEKLEGRSCYGLKKS